MNRDYDLIVVGAGIVGLGAAWAAKRLDARVLVIETQRRAQGASVRNFGMIWPIGQPSGERRQLALRNRELWLALADASATNWSPPRTESERLEVRRCGSVHVAHHDDEWNVLQEFHAANTGQELQLLTRPQTHRLSPAVVNDGLRGSLYSPWECGVDPRQAIRAAASALEAAGVDFQYNQQVIQANTGEVIAADGRRWEAARIIVCSGAEFSTLFPEHHRQSGIRPCKLQMLRCGPQPNGFQLGPHLASGLTLRHYESFRGCPSVARVRQRIADRFPELDQFGIHVMASQGLRGEIILGDSHEYEEAVTPFDQAEIEQLMLREMRKVYRLPSWEIVERWHGVYAKHPTSHFVALDPAPGVKILNGLGGSGMSLGLAVSEKVVHGWMTS